MSPLVRAVGLAVGRSGASAPVLEGVDLTLAPGECVLLRGDTGSGKSTLLRLLAGLAGVERRAGVLDCPKRVALLLQHVETQLLCTTVAEEVRLGLRSRGLAPDVIDKSVRHALARVGLSALATREVDRLSAGEKQRLLLAALIAIESPLLLLDEPCSSLDARARRALATVLAEFKARGTALLIAEHAPRELLGIVDRCFEIEQGRLHEVVAPVCEDTDETAARRGVSTQGCSSLASLTRGERVLLTGRNGCGKSSRLRALAQAAARTMDVALVIQEPRRSLFSRTVETEVAFALRRRGVSAPDREARVRAVLHRFDLLPFAARSPRRLSYGQQHRLAIAAAVAARPALVLLDEPFAGLDAGARARLLDVLADEQEETGATLVLASHDCQPLDSWCDRVVLMSGEEDSRG